LTNSEEKPAALQPKGHARKWHRFGRRFSYPKHNLEEGKREKQRVSET